MSDLEQKIALLERRLAREKAARAEAENLLESKARDLYEANQQLIADHAATQKLLDSLASSVDQLLDTYTDEPPIDHPISSDKLSQLFEELISRDLQNRELLKRQKLALDEHAIVSICDANERITYVNSRFSALTGYASEDILGLTHRVLTSGHHPKPYIDPLYQQVLSGNIWQGELCNRAKDGSLYWVSATVIPFCNPQTGKLDEIIAIETDITAKKQLAEQLQRDKLFLNQLTNSMDEGVYVIDRSSKCLFINQKACELLQLSAAEITGKPIYSLIMTDAELYDEDPVLLMTASEEHFETDQMEMQRSDGSVFSAALKARSTELTDHGRGAVCVFRDNTASIQLEQARALAVRQAQLTAAAKSNFLANMSHEIRTPMNAVVGLTHMLQQTNINPQQQDYVHKIQQSTQNLLGIINDILDFSRIDSGSFALTNQPFTLDTLLQELFFRFQPKANEKQLSFKLINSLYLQQALIGDAARLRQILANLLSNAIKFTEKGSVSLEVSGQQVHGTTLKLKFCVKDTGIGIPEAQIAQLGTPFSQLDGSITRRFGGTGLGLSIAYQLVKLMDGKIKIDSTVNRGSEFCITLNLPLEQSKPIANSNSGHVLPQIVFFNPGPVLLNLAEQCGMDYRAIHELEATSKPVANSRIIIDLLTHSFNPHQAILLCEQLKSWNIQPIILADSATQRLLEESKINAKDALFQAALLPSQLCATVHNQTKAQPLRPADLQGLLHFHSQNKKSTAKTELAECFDHQHALRQMGEDNELLQRSLEQFVAAHKQDGEKLQHALVQDDLTLAKRIAHTLKGLAGTLGLNTLLPLCHSIEAALEKADKHASQLFAVLIHYTLQASAKEISQYLQQTPVDNLPENQLHHVANTEASAPLDLSLINTLIASLTALVSEGDIESSTVALELKQALQGSAYASTGERIALLCEHFDFDAAAEQIEHLTQRLAA